MKVLVVDDELPARERLANMLRDMDDKWLLAGTAENGQQALDFIAQEPVDVVLLDIRMPVMDGLQTAGHLSKMQSPPAVIFTTAYDEYALKAFDANGSAYLLKPVKKDRLVETLERIGRLNRAQMDQIPDDQEVYLSGNYRGGVQRIALKDIACFQAEQKYVIACAGEREVLLDSSLKLLEEKFAGQFVRVHRNALAAKARITALEKNTDGQSVLVLEGTARKLEVSRRHLPAIRKALKSGA